MIIIQADEAPTLLNCNNNDSNYNYNYGYNNKGNFLQTNSAEAMAASNWGRGIHKFPYANTIAQR